MYYVILDNDGFVVGNGNSNLLPRNAVEVDKLYPLQTSYVKDGVVKELGPKPSEDYSIDKVNKTWVLDLNKVTTRIKAERDNLLKGSDWTQLPDVPLTTKELWAGYRQELRDITMQKGYPTDIIWPTPPQ